IALGWLWLVAFPAVARISGASAVPAAIEDGLNAASTQNKGKVVIVFRAFIIKLYSLTFLMEL
ncbi:MAG: hypothetical protein ACREUM_11385, partial [Nitrosospira sp.]